MEHLKFLTKYAIPHTHYDPEPLLKKGLDTISDREDVDFIFKHPGLNSNVLQHAMDKNITDLTKKALRSDKVSPEQIEQAFKSPSESIRAAAMQYHAKPEHIEKAFGDTSFVRMTAAQNPNASSEQLHRFIRDPDMFVVMSAAINPSLQKEHLDHLVSYPNNKVRRAVVDNQSHAFTDDHWKKLVNDPHYEVRGMARTFAPDHIKQHFED
jgi:hypothetical protein